MFWKPNRAVVKAYRPWESANVSPVANVWNQKIEQGDFVLKTIDPKKNPEKLIPMQGKFNWSDADGDAITKVRFYDRSTLEDFVGPLGGVVKQIDGYPVIEVDANKLNDVYFSVRQLGNTYVSVSVFDGQVWSDRKDFTITTYANKPPVVNAWNLSMKQGQSLSMAGNFSASDPDGDSIKLYAFYENSSVGYFTASGEGNWTEQNGKVLIVPEKNLNTVRFVGENLGNSQIGIVLNDGKAWGQWKYFNISVQSNNKPPVVNTWNLTVTEDQSIPMQGNFSYYDPDGDSTITKFQFSESTPIADFTGKFKRINNSTIEVNAKDLNSVRLLGVQPGFASPTLSSIRAFDGQVWSEWKNFGITTLAKNSGSNPVPTSPVPTSKDEFFSIGRLGEFWDFSNSVSSTNRNDFYSFNIDKRSNLWAGLNTINTNARLSILAEGGRLLKQIDTSADGSASWILEPGNYQIKIERTSGDTNYNFNLHRVNLVGDIKNEGLSFLQNYEDRTHKDGVNFYHINEKGERIYDGLEANKDTIIVIHGWTDTSSSESIKNLLAQAANKYKDYQVLALDWTNPAKDAPNPGSENQDYNNGRDQKPGVPWHAARSIAPVAQWAKETLNKLGIGAEKISLFGHSLGSYVSAEIGHLFGKVENLVAIDPAYPGYQYDIDGNKEGDQRITEFKDAAKNSLAFVVKEDGIGSVAGDGHTANKAKNSLVISYEGWANPIDAASPHGKAIDVAADALSKGYLKLENNLALPRDLRPDKYGDSGNYIRWTGTHEGRVTATRDGKIKELAYINGSSWGIDQETKTWNWG